VTLPSDSAVDYPEFFRKEEEIRDAVGSATGMRLLFGTDFDKGHFIAFSIGGEISGGETNIFPHNGALNRGRSEEGRVYRRLETFAANHPGTLFFHRPVYEQETDTPGWLEVGIIRPDLSLWIEVFDNRPSSPPASPTATTWRPP
jgi:hypothetical protein